MQPEPSCAVWALKQVIMATFADSQMRNPKTTTLIAGIKDHPIMPNTILFSLEILQCKLLTGRLFN